MSFFDVSFFLTAPSFTKLQQESVLHFYHVESCLWFFVDSDGKGSWHIMEKLHRKYNVSRREVHFCRIRVFSEKVRTVTCSMVHFQSGFLFGKLGCFVVGISKWFKPGSPEIIFISSFLFNFRILWVLVVIGAIIFFSIQVKDRIAAYLRHESIVNFEVRYTDKLDYPAITICNQNTFR